MSVQRASAAGSTDLVAALGALPDPVCRVDHAGRVVEGNAAFRALCRCVGAASCVLDHSAEPIAAALRGALRSFEADLATEDGRQLRLAWSAVPDGDGLLLVGHDVTALHSAIQAQASSNRRLQALMDALPIGVSFSDDASCTRITGNAALLAQFAARADDNLSASAVDAAEHGRQVRFQHRGRPVQAAELPLQRAVAENAVIAPFELDVELPDGRTWVCEASGAPIRDARGGVIGGVALTIDVTDRRRAEEAARERAQRIERLAQTAPGVLHAFRRGPDGKVAFSYGGERVAALYGVAPERLARGAEAVFELIHPDDLPRVHATIEDSAAELRPWHEEFRIRSPRHGEIWIEGHSAPLRDADGGITWHGFVSDVTARKRDELRLRRALAQLTARSRELQDFAFIASHDLQEPLRKISAFCDKLLVRHGANLEPVARDYLQRSIDAAARMQALVADLLAYSRVLSRGKAFQPVSLAEVLAEVREDLAMRIEETGATIDAGALPVLHADRSQLRQLLQNLVGNALKFQVPGRAPVVRVEAEPHALDEGRPGWRLRVADNGIGFEPRFAERIFVPFERLHDREAYPGTGIGLAIVRRIVERHQGRVLARGVPGEGATFEVDLPAEPLPEAGWTLPDEALLGEAVAPSSQPVQRT